MNAAVFRLSIGRWGLLWGLLPFLFISLNACSRAAVSRTGAADPGIRIIPTEQALALVYTTPTLQVEQTPSPNPETQQVTTYTLEQVQALARGGNPSFAIFAANREAAQAEVLRALAYPNPQLELGLGVARSREEPSMSGLEYGFGLSQAIEWPATRRARREAAEAGAPLAALESASFRAQLRADVARAYTMVLFHQRAERLAQAAAGTEEQILQLVTKRVDGGEAPPLDLIRARVETLQAQRAAKEQTRLLAAARAVLNALVGRNMPPAFALADTLDLPPPPINPAEAERLALAQHPELRRLQAVVEQRERIVRQEQTAWYPALTLGFGPQRALDTDSIGATLGLALPLWDRNQGGIAAAQAAAAAARAEIERARQEILLELETSQQRYGGACEQLAAFEIDAQGGLRTQASEALRIAMFLYREGEADLLQLLDALRTHQATEAEHLQAQIDVQLARAELERAIGIGGEE